MTGNILACHIASCVFICCTNISVKHTVEIYRDLLRSPSDSPRSCAISSECGRPRFVQSPYRTCYPCLTYVASYPGYVRRTVVRVLNQQQQPWPPWSMYTTHRGCSLSGRCTRTDQANIRRTDAAEGVTIYRAVALACHARTPQISRPRSVPRARRYGAVRQIFNS